MAAWLLWNSDSSVSLGGGRVTSAAVPENSADSLGADDAGDVVQWNGASRSPVDAREVVIRTLDAALQPLGGARVFVTSELGMDQIGSTDSEGILVARAPKSSGWLVASKPGYATAFSRMVTSAPGSSFEVVLMLDSECAIRGEVRAPGGVAPQFPVTVYAWPESIRPTDAWLRTESEGTPLRAAVEPDGQFELRGLSHGRRYCVTAAAEGCVADSIECWDAPSYGVQLKLKWVHALEVRAVDSSGQHVRTSGALYEAAGTTWGVIRGGRSSGRLTIDDPRARLMMLDPGVRESDSSSRILLIYLSDTGTAVGPFAMTWRVPGYAPKDVELLVPRLESATPPVELVHLDSRATCWGAASIRVSVGAAPLDTSVLALGELRWRGVGTKDTYSTSIYRAGTRTLDGIPCGTYEVNLLVRSSAVIGTTLGLPVTIGSDSETPVDFDLSRLGTITVSILRGAGDAFERAFDGYLVLNDRARIPVQFLGAPYVVGGLPPGSYGLSVTSPASLAARAVAAPVDVSAGGSANLQVIWPD